MAQPGLRNFRESDAIALLDEALLLLESALVERQADHRSAWRAGMKRGAQLLEWLSQAQIRPPGVPTQLLAAAAYQAAGLPAMSAALLLRAPDEPASNVLRHFLRADFPATSAALRDFWQQFYSAPPGLMTGNQTLSAAAVRHVMMSLGTLCNYFRTGDSMNVERALTKLDNLSGGFLHSPEVYSHLLARLTSIAARDYVEQCLWRRLGELEEVSSENANQAYEQFARSAFENRRLLVWPPQAVGIAHLATKRSFILCTPTGSGKTTIATLATLQSLFEERIVPPGLEGLEQGGLTMYLVPSRALASEIETRLSDDLAGVVATPIVITGLYGGVDWGPTDAWIQADSPTVLICTFEKADALLRYLGVLFLNRVRLVVIDEAHMVQQDPATVQQLREGASRAYRLEQLGSRLLSARDLYGFRIVALSAVAGGAAPAMARWLTGGADDAPATSTYRSTRQMIGRLEVSLTGHFTIHYDLMDGRPLEFEEDNRRQGPYVPAPIPPLPEGLPDEGPEVRLRAPTLWAALHLAAERVDGSTPSVLVSLTQRPDTFASTCADLLDEWQALALPAYRRPVDETDRAWPRCLAIVADYFGEASLEYRLLQHGVALHHGKLPGLLARRLKTVMDRGYVRVIIATSTLSEGVNIPVTYILLPSAYRGVAAMAPQEFANLSGRAGRPGVGTEGHILAVLAEPQRVREGRRVFDPGARLREGYEHLRAGVEAAQRVDNVGGQVASAVSPLAELLNALERAWREISRERTPGAFDEWLARTAVVDTPRDAPPAIEYLDALDHFLVAAIEELEQLRFEELPPAALEQELQRIWGHTYAHASAREEQRLRETWMTRGNHIKSLYPERRLRRRIYRSSLPPRSSVALQAASDALRVRLNEGRDYASRGIEQRLAFIQDVLQDLSVIPSFRIEERISKGRNSAQWPQMLRWWFAKATLVDGPRSNQITAWYSFVNRNFIYRGAWGVGSIIGLLLDPLEGEDPILALELNDWPRSGLPWIAFWLKELITWGTLEPVAAFLLARGDALDRPTAERDAAAFYATLPDDMDPNERLDPRRVRDWLQQRQVRDEPLQRLTPVSIGVELARPAAAFARQRLPVEPTTLTGRVQWVEAAGHVVASNEVAGSWIEQPNVYSFELDVQNAAVRATPYRLYA